MPNLRGTSPVGHNEGSRSYVTRNGRHGGMKLATSRKGGGLSPNNDASAVCAR